MNHQNVFQQTVKESRALSSEQKELLLADPRLPDAYQKKVAALLSDFDKHSKEREAYLRDKMEQLYTDFIRELETEVSDELMRKELAETMKNQMDSFFPKTTSV